MALAGAAGAGDGFEVGAVVGGAGLGSGVTARCAATGAAVGTLTGTAGYCTGAGVTSATWVGSGFGDAGAGGTGVGFGGALGFCLASSRRPKTGLCPASTGRASGFPMRGACVSGGCTTCGTLFVRWLTRTCETTTNGAPSLVSGDDCSDDDVTTEKNSNATSA